MRVPFEYATRVAELKVEALACERGKIGNQQNRMQSRNSPITDGSDGLGLKLHLRLTNVSEKFS